MHVPSSSSKAICVFKCLLRPKHGRQPKNRNYKACPDELLYHLVFFNTFEELNLPIKGPMEEAGVIKLYKPSPTLCLFVAPTETWLPPRTRTYRDCRKEENCTGKT
jgi:hypothetical protein